MIVKAVGTIRIQQSRIGPSRLPWMSEAWSKPSARAIAATRSVTWMTSGETWMTAGESGSWETTYTKTEAGEYPELPTRDGGASPRVMEPFPLCIHPATAIAIILHLVVGGSRTIRSA